ncbi:protein ANTAGONIST OF LIKE HETEROCHROMATIN PROTEIN 1-like [Cannabis sativa]|uniref:protein ANTAGONIST OF LIKE HETEROCHROMATIN PROTEIN 1-like n=1 Tax=Cannabis sativa TaxID=3483 RepID=UPI0029C9F845|nr:protein ANTAGONIST OF LIKE HETEROCHROMATIN PROTEIN 1-like [Cannabis sativa]
MGILVLINAYIKVQQYYEKHMLKNRTFVNNETRLSILDTYIRNGDIECVNELRMDRRTFGVLCELLRHNGRLKVDGLVTIEEKVCIFLNRLAHHVKNRTIHHNFKQSGETVSRYFNAVLSGVLRLQASLLVVPERVSESCNDDRWKWFKNCLRALDGTHIEVHISETDKPTYRNRKGKVTTNMLGVCDRDMNFIFVLSGWEGLASDSRVLRDAITRAHGLRVPEGYYYLVDASYTNCEGFLAPYRGTRYHLSEWQHGCAPTNEKEFFNMKHSSARNIIERCFGLLKIRWAILRSPSFYPIKTQCRIMTACCLLHNFIRREMSYDPMEAELDAQDSSKN